MGAVAKIKVGGRWSFGANRKEWGDQEFTKSGITDPVIIRHQGVLASAQSVLMNKGVGVTSTHLVYVQHISATSTGALLYVILCDFAFLKIPPGEAVQFSPHLDTTSMSLYNSGSVSAITFDFSIIGSR